MAIRYYKHDLPNEPKQSTLASNSGLRGSVQMDVNRAGWTARIGNNTVSSPGVTFSKVLSSMQENFIDISKSAYARPKVTRKALDLFRYGNFSLNLFYEGKELCLELRDESGNSELGKWVFCVDRRHERLFSDEDFTVRVLYRPASIEVTFIERDRKSFMQRWFSSTGAKSRDTWCSYELQSDGAVQINRPGKEYCVI